MRRRDFSRLLAALPPLWLFVGRAQQPALPVVGTLRRPRILWGRTGQRVSPGLKRHRIYGRPKRFDRIPLGRAVNTTG
jgi:hypothetical protein